MKKLYKLALLMIAICAPLSGNAGNVTVKTEKAVGEKMTFATNGDISLTLSWGNGDEEFIGSTGEPFDVTVKHETLTISSSSNLTRLYAADNGLTEIDLAGVATTLVKLNCSSNKLKTLNLSACTKLSDLDCQDNQIETITFRTMPGIRNLNCMDNKLQTFNYTLAMSMESILADNNELTSLPTTKTTKLKHLYCQNNSLATLDLSNNAMLKTLVASNNQLEELDLSKNTLVEDVWVGNNALTSLNVRTTTKLVSLVANDNNMDSVMWTKNEPATLKYLDLSGNNLFPLYFPKVYNNGPLITYFKLDNQQPFTLTSEDVEINVTQKWNTLINRDAWSTVLRPTIEFICGETVLEKGTDYKFASVSSFNTTFLKPYNNVIVRLTNDRYFPDLVYESKPFNVIDPTVGIDILNTEDKNAKQEIYTLEGIRVSDKNLKKGVYIINGKKAIIK